MAKEFLYEYGDMEITTYMRTPGDAKGVLSTKALLLGYFKIDMALDTLMYYGNIKHFLWHTIILTMQPWNAMQMAEFTCRVMDQT